MWFLLQMPEETETPDNPEWILISKTHGPDFELKEAAHHHTASEGGVKINPSDICLIAKFIVVGQFTNI